MKSGEFNGMIFTIPWFDKCNFVNGGRTSGLAFNEDPPESSSVITSECGVTRMSWSQRKQTEIHHAWKTRLCESSYVGADRNVLERGPRKEKIEE